MNDYVTKHGTYELTEEDHKMLAALEESADAEIDLGDAPQLAGGSWNWVRPRGRKGRPQLVWIDSDILQWLRAEYPDQDVGPAVEDALRRIFESRRKPDRAEAA